MTLRKFLLHVALAPIWVYMCAGFGVSSLYTDPTFEEVKAGCPLLLKPLCAYEVGAVVSFHLRESSGLLSSPLAVLLPYEYAGIRSFLLRNPGYSIWQEPDSSS